jgi:hypothetical protein
MAFTGGCQCGRVRYRAEAPRDRSSICYCRMCQRASGGPFMAFVRFRAGQVAWTMPPETFASSNLVERGFCRACGTPLMYRVIGGEYLSVTLNSLDDPTAVAPEFVFTPEARPAWLGRLDALVREEMDFAGRPALVSGQFEPDAGD